MNATNKPIDRAAAWVCLMTNLFVMPGVGSWIAGQRVLGAVQITLSVAGMGMMVFWLVWFVTRWIHDQQMPQSLGPFVGLAIAGIVVFVFTWSWSLVASVSLVRNAEPAAAPGKPPHLT